MDSLTTKQVFGLGGCFSKSRANVRSPFLRRDLPKSGQAKQKAIAVMERNTKCQVVAETRTAKVFMKNGKPHIKNPFTSKIQECREGEGFRVEQVPKTRKASQGDSA